MDARPRSRPTAPRAKPSIGALQAAPWSGPKPLRQRLEKGDARAGGQFGIAREDVARERDAGRLAAAGQQFFAELDKVGGALLGGALAALARAIEQRAAAIRDRLQHVAEEGGVHASSPVSSAVAMR